MDKSKNILKKWTFRATASIVVVLLLNIFIFTQNNLYDGWLTDFTGEVSYRIAYMYDHQLHIEKYDFDGLNNSGCRVLCKNSGGVFIGDSCNGRDLFLLYLGFIFSVPTVGNKRRWIYAIIGLGIIFFANVLRIVLLLFLASDFPHLLNIMHKYIFQILMYLLLFAMWSKFLRKITLNYDLNES